PIGIDETTLVPRQAGPELKAQPTLPPITSLAPPPPVETKAAPVETPANAAVEWKEYTAKADRFSVLMPGPVKEDKLSLPTLLGNIENRIYQADVKGLHCEVACADVPVPPGQEDAFFTNFVQFMFTARNGS